MHVHLNGQGFMNAGISIYDLMLKKQILNKDIK